MRLNKNPKVEVFGRYARIDDQVTWIIPDFPNETDQSLEDDYTDGSWETPMYTNRNPAQGEVLYWMEMPDKPLDVI